MNLMPIVFIPEPVYKEIMLSARVAKGEISWIGEVMLCPGGVLISEVFLIEQKTTPSKTKLVDEAYAQFLMQYIQRGKDIANLKLWVHSHADMGVFWSPVTDEGTINTHRRAEYFLSLVVNRKGERLARIDLFFPFRVTMDELEIVVMPEYPPELVAQVTEQVARLVSFKPDPPAKKGKPWYFQKPIDEEEDEPYGPISPA